MIPTHFDRSFFKMRGLLYYKINVRSTLLIKLYSKPTMADKTLGVKVSEELHDKVKNIKKT